MYTIKMDVWNYSDVRSIARLLDKIGIDTFKINSIQFKSFKINGVIYIARKSAYTKNYSAVLVSDGMSGKMENIPSISTSCRKNTYCVERCNSNDDNCICTHCFAVKTLSGYSGANLDKVLSWNYEILTNEILPTDVLPIFNNKNDIVRFESFGDLQNAIQAINYLNIAILNPHIMFALWSKNMWILKTAIDYIGFIPSNVVIIESSPYIDADFTKSFDFVEKVFLVDSIASEKINCCDGIVNRKCNECRRCYAHNGENEIHELLR